MVEMRAVFEIRVISMHPHVRAPPEDVVLTDFQAKSGSVEEVGKRWGVEADLAGEPLLLRDSATESITHLDSTLLRSALAHYAKRYWPLPYT